MDSNIKNKIELHFLDLKNEAEDKADYYLKLAEKNDEFKKINNELSLLLIEIGKAEAFELDNIEKLKQKKIELENKRDKVLAKIKIDKKQLSPTYHCTDCNDTGFLPNGSKCKCYKVYETQLINEKIGANMKLYDFSSAKVELNPNINYTVVKNFCDKFPDTKTKNFIFFGQTGCGKTFVAQSIGSELIKKNFSVVCISAFQMNKAFLMALESSNSYILQHFIDCDMLIIDDLGSEPIIDKITLQNFLNILSERLFNQKNFIITTNLDSQQLMDRYGERIFSRLMNKNDTAFVNFYGKDIRTRKY